MAWGTGSWPGTGTELDPYQVPNGAAFNEVRNDVATGKYYKQTANISLSAYSNFTPLSTVGFYAEYDGDGYDITDLTINDASSVAADRTSLFGVLYGTVKNFWLKNVSATYGRGAVVAFSMNGTAKIQNVTVGEVDDYATVASSSYYPNAFVGNAISTSEMEISNCVVFADLTSTSSGIEQRGGLLIGYLDNCVVRDCAVVGSFTISDSGVLASGGMIGYLKETDADDTVTDCVSYVDFDLTSASAKSEVGGFFGMNDSSNTRHYTNRCAAGGTITNAGGTLTSVGGFVGACTSTVNYCFFDEDTGYATDPVASGLTATEFKDSANFTNFDFVDDWFMLTDRNLSPANYSALPTEIVDKPWPIAVQDAVGGIEKQVSYYARIVNDKVIRKIYKGETEYNEIVVQT